MRKLIDLLLRQIGVFPVGRTVRNEMRLLGLGFTLTPSKSARIAAEGQARRRCQSAAGAAEVAHVPVAANCQQIAERWVDEAVAPLAPPTPEAGPQDWVYSAEACRSSGRLRQGLVFAAVFAVAAAVVAAAVNEPAAAERPTAVVVVARSTA